MSDHTINLALLISAIITGGFEAAIFWMILQDYRKARAMPELSPKRWIVLACLSVGPLLALFVIWLFATNLRSKPESIQIERPAWWLYGLLLLVGAAVGLVISRLIRPQVALISALPTEKPRKPSKLVIHWANYRAVAGGGVVYEVGDFLRQIISGDSLVFDIENDNFVIGNKNFAGDPLWGKEKRLQVNYSYGGNQPVTTERREHGRLLLPEDSKIKWLQGEVDRLIAAQPKPVQYPVPELRGKIVSMVSELQGFLGSHGEEPRLPKVDREPGESLNEFLGKAVSRPLEPIMQWRTKFLGDFRIRFGISVPSLRDEIMARARKSDSRLNGCIDTAMHDPNGNVEAVVGIVGRFWEMAKDINC